MVARCAFFDDDGRPIGHGCRDGRDRCKYVHPESRLWAIATPAKNDFARRMRASVQKEAHRPAAAPKPSASASSARNVARRASRPSNELPEARARCVFFDDDGRPIDRGCDLGARCPYVHPSSFAWDSAPVCVNEFAKKIRRARAHRAAEEKSRAAADKRAFSGKEDMGWAGRAKKTGAPSQPDVSASSATPPPRPASPAASPTRPKFEPAGEPGPSYTFTFTFGASPTPAADPAGGEGPGRATAGDAGLPTSAPTKLSDWFESEEQPAVAKALTFASETHTTAAASAKAPTLKAPTFVPATHTAMPAPEPAPAPTPVASSSAQTRVLDPKTSSMKVILEKYQLMDTSVDPAAPEQPLAPNSPPAAAVTAPPESYVSQERTAAEKHHALPDLPPAATDPEPREIYVPPESPARQEKPATRDIPATAQPKSLADIQNNSKSFVKQLLDAVFKTHELARAKSSQAKTKRLAESTHYGHASRKTRATLETLKSAVDEDNLSAQGRLDSRVARLAGLPSVGEHLVAIAAALSGANAQFDTYLTDVEEWRSGYEPRAQQAYAEYEVQVQEAEEALAKDDRPDWLRKMPQLTRQYEQFVQLEHAANELELERDARYDEPGASLAQELVELLQQEDWPGRLWKTAEDEQQYAADVYTMELVDDLRLQDVELRQQLVELNGAIDVVVNAAQDEEESESHADYMARMRRKISRRHEQHTERASAIRAQHAQLAELMKQPDPTAAQYDTSELAAQIESRIQQDVDGGFLSVAQRLEAYKMAASNLLSKADEYLGETEEEVRLVSYYVDGNEQLREAVMNLLEEQLTQEQLAAS